MTTPPTRTGSGPGSITPDGCAVELYALLQPAGEPELVHAHAPVGGSVLDLGAGAGRVADPLVGLGHRVVAVDESADMLDRVTSAETVLGRIEDLDLADRFDVVLLAGHLVNTDDDRQRHELLASAARHVADDGVVLLQWHPPEWFTRLTTGAHFTHSSHGVTTALDVLTLDDDHLTGQLTYTHGDSTWTQRFRARRLSEDDLAGALASAGLRADGFADDDRLWVRARPTGEDLG
ncbi:class I SAM-dependent methyltransferase [Thalassiella azotivora]